MDLAAQTWVVTGAAGKVGTGLRAALAARVGRLRLLDLVPLAPERDNEESFVVDVRDQAALNAAFAGAHGVVHLGGIPDEADFHDLAEINVVGTFHVFEAARRSGASRVVFASSNHATGLYPRDVVVDPRVPTRPDGLYGVSKIAGEALGQLYADKFGLTVTSLRIGSFEEEPQDLRQLSTWLSPADAVRAVVAAMTKPSPGHDVFYAVSRNRRRWWDLAAGEALGFDPQDDAERFADRFGQPGEDDPSAPQGGDNAAPSHTLDRQRRPD